MGYYARDLNQINFFGWPLAFYMSAQGSLIIYVIIIWYYARYMNNLDRVYDVKKGRKNNGYASDEQRHRGRIQRRLDRQFKSQLKKVYTSYTGGFIVFVVVLGDRRADGPSEELDRLHLPACHGRSLRGHRRDEPHVRCGRVLRRRPARTCAVQRHGDRRRLDVARRRSSAWPARCTSSGFNGLAFILGWTGGYCLVALFLAPYLRKFGQFTIPDFLGARFGGNIPRFVGILRGDPVLVHVRRGADLRRRPHHHAPDGRDLRDRRVPRPGRHPGLLLPGWHARGDVDAGRAVHHPHRRVHDSGGLAVGEDHWRSRSAGRLRQGAGEGHGARRAADQGSRRRSRFATYSSSGPRTRPPS